MTDFLSKTIAMNSSKRALWYIVRKNKANFIKETLLVMLAMLPIALMTLMPARIADAAFTNNSDALLVNCVGFVILGLIHGILWHQADMYYVKHTYPIFYDTGRKTFQYVIEKEYPEFVASSPSKMAQYTNELRENVDRIWTSIHWGYIGFAFQVPATVIISLKVSWIQAVIYILSIALLIYVLTRRSSRLNKLMDKMYTQDTSLSSVVIDSLTNFVNVKSFNAENKELHQYDSLLASAKTKYDVASTDYMKYWFAASKVIRFVTWPLIIASTYLLFSQGKINAQQVVLSISVLIGLTEFVWGLVDRIANAKKNFSKLQNGYSYLAGKANMFEESLDNASRTTPDSSPIEFKKSLILKDLNFAYPDKPDENVLDGLDLIIHKNEKIGVVGKSGGGKSTLVKLLLGFYDFEKGSILIDDKEVTKFDLTRLNTYVPQDTSLFQQTVKYNIAYAKQTPVSDTEVVTAAKKAHAHEFISKLKDGYDTLVGERGIKLSLGQRQRIAIARAFLKDSDLLILDEATSALDSKTEANIQEALEELWHNKTVIAIAHRLSTLNNVDRIVVIDKGKIAEIGTKSELLKKNGLFAELWHQQKNGLL